MSNFIEITQDGIGRISFHCTPSNIEGLLTSGIATCVAVILRGVNGISLVHDTGQITEATLKRELAWVGALQTISFAINPAYADDINMENKRFIYHLGKPVNLISTTSGFISVTRQGVTSIEKSAEIISVPLPEAERRFVINYLINMRYAKSDGDLQYDGTSFLLSPRLPTSLDEYKTWAITLLPRFRQDLAQEMIYAYEQFEQRIACQSELAKNSTKLPSQPSRQGITSTLVSISKGQLDAIIEKLKAISGNEESWKAYQKGTVFLFEHPEQATIDKVLDRLKKTQSCDAMKTLRKDTGASVIKLENIIVNKLLSVSITTDNQVGLEFGQSYMQNTHAACPNN